MAEGENMSKKKSSKAKKEAEARTKVNGHASFENGKLVKPATDELLELMTLKEENARLKEELSKRTRTVPKLEELPNVEDCPIQYINFCQVQKARDEMLHILEEIESLGYVEIRHNKYGETYRVAGQTVAELWPLKRGWSSCIKPHSVKRWDMEEFLTAFKERVEEIKAQCEKEQKGMPKPTKVTTGNASKKIESVEDIKGRIEKLSEGNAIHIKKVSPEIKAFVEAQKYKLIDSEEGGANLLVR